MNKRIAKARTNQWRASRASWSLSVIASLPLVLVCTTAFADDKTESTLASIAGSSIGHSIAGSSIGQSIGGSSIGVLSSVYLVGRIAGADELAGTITVGDVVVYAGSASIFGTPTVGSIALVSGTYPQTGNLVIADTIASLSLEEGALPDDGLTSIVGSSRFW
ncbi:MAG TPA: hypothetical protein VMR74_07990 [Gammaproteobacteria bacterium]|nr:hypothetical protein [Gammaproteobacteria bacterium]